MRGGASVLRPVHGRDGGRDLDGRRGPVERAACVEQQALVAGLALAAAANTALELDLERLLLHDQVAAEDEALVVDRLDRGRSEVDLRVPRRLEEVGGDEVRVALLVVGAQAVDADRAHDRRLAAAVEPTLELREAAVDGAEEITRV